METMERTAVQSREIAIIGFEPQTSTLEVAFRNGGVYHYSGVSEDVYKALMAAPSLGKYFEKNIKHQYPYQKLA